MFLSAHEHACLLLFLYQVVSQKGFRSFEDKSSAINADTGVDKKLVDLINDWRLPGMKLCVGKPEYKVIIESKLVSICSLSRLIIEQL
jgi:nucleolar protein 58